MELKFRVPILIFSTILVILMIVHLFTFVTDTYTRVDHGSQIDSSVIQKRLNNVNFYYVPDPDTAHPDVVNRYPLYGPPLTPNGPMPPKRIRFAKFSNCPPFRLSDDGKSVYVG